MKIVKWVAWILVIVGALNWGLVGVANFNLVDYLFAGTYINRIIYVLVGIAALYLIFSCSCKSCKSCKM